MALPKKISELTEANTYNSNTYMVVVVDGVTKKISAVNFNKTPSGLFEYIGGPYTPANSTITISQGAVFYDNTYFYCATANNQIKRIAWETF